MAHKMPHTAARKPTKADLTQVPIEHIDLEKVRNIADLLDGYERISFQARSLGQCAHILERAMLDPECTIFFGAAGARIVGRGAPRAPWRARGEGPELLRRRLLSARRAVLRPRVERLLHRNRAHEASSGSEEGTKADGPYRRNQGQLRD